MKSQLLLILLYLLTFGQIVEAQVYTVFDATDPQIEGSYFIDENDRNTGPPAIEGGPYNRFVGPFPNNNFEIVNVIGELGVYEWQLRNISNPTDPETTYFSFGDTAPNPPSDEDTNGFPAWDSFSADFDFASGQLPVTYTHFQATPRGNAIVLDWGTSSEEDNEGFDIEHSTDGRRWEVLDFVPGQGNSELLHEYRYVHRDPAPGENLYRLRQWDYDGAYEYSAIVSATAGGGRTPIRAYPNPTSGTFWLDFPAELQGESLDLEVLDGTGRLVWRRSGVVAAARAGFELPATLPHGPYLILCRTPRDVRRLRIQKM